MNKKWIGTIVVIFFVVTGILVSNKTVQKMKLHKTLIMPTPTAPPLSSTNITVQSPKQYQTINGRFAVRGIARVFENQVSIRVKNASTNKEYVETTAYVDSPDVGQFGPFTYIVDVSKENLQPRDQLKVEVFQPSAKDGTEIDKVVVYLNYKKN